ncbi:hypothetical protein B0H17DRAFT_1148673 [Mycena rosella]|uniref:Uncharacterized protein n=1 Tax=Mycena rosella TaxID=1033263 RepID=A0AAD7C9P8_MYCRO|nr:hypothetical protein B0H17DRAFT_1148673 [Mycena rosella]
MLCGIPNISVVEYGGGWRATEAVEVAEVEETSIPGGGWRATEAAEVEETSIPVSILSTKHTRHISWNRRQWMEGDGGGGGGGDLHPSWYTFHGTAGGGWRVTEAAERVELYVKI